MVAALLVEGAYNVPCSRLDMAPNDSWSTVLALTGLNLPNKCPQHLNAESALGWGLLGANGSGAMRSMAQWLGCYEVYGALELTIDIYGALALTMSPWVPLTKE